MEEISRKILNEIQKGFPLVSQPFRVLGESVGCSGPECLFRIRALKDQGWIRDIGPVFNAKALGYQGALVAMKVPPGRIEESARQISAHPGVSHNYERLDDFNLWFTIMVPPGRDLPSEVEDLRELSEPSDVMVLPEVRVFKIRVRFDFPSGKDRVPENPGGDPAPEDPCRGGPFDFDEEDRFFIRAFQAGIPLSERPFEDLSGLCGITEELFLEKARGMVDRGIVRRVAAVLNHRLAGFRENALVVWNVPEPERDQAGRKIAEVPEVSHCYERLVPPEWPYPVFSMIHGKDAEDFDRIIRGIIGRTGGFEHKILRTGREFKKTRPRFFVFPEG
ncbi:MAG TPA: AsnC family transcriptional regulator [Candidatus Omnitrophota bacterium]|nr:AsnC family transcriptional regulator [Candidatus Omnitrophota bacterium]